MKYSKAVFPKPVYWIAKVDPNSLNPETPFVVIAETHTTNYDIMVMRCGQLAKESQMGVKYFVVDNKGNRLSDIFYGEKSPMTVVK